MARSKNYIFRKDDNGELLFQGDFEGYYQNNSDPWDQNSTDSDMSEYYKVSRLKLLKVIKGIISNQNILEIGCGLGLVTNMLDKELENSLVSGVDISSTAIHKAKAQYSNILFYEGDIADKQFKSEEQYDVVILNEMLWYVLEDIDLVINNIYEILNTNGSLIITMAFLNDQQYGKEIINGYSGLLDYCKLRISSLFKIISKDFDTTKRFDYNYGIVCLRKL
jgi:2-polyprenyl-3-methyl-5-hydroxy-6-metoxy-1,4-benzoquinol methylase